MPSLVLRSLVNRLVRALCAPRMLYGWRRADGTFLPHTRISSSTAVDSPAGLDIQDHVYVGHFNLLDAAGGLHLGEGCQVTTHCALLTHSSHHALRVAGRAYWGAAEPPAFVRQPTHIGAYTFVGPHSVVMPGSHVGRGVIVRAFSYVEGAIPDFAIVAGQPAVVVGDTRHIDAAWLTAHPQDRAAYEAWAGPLKA